ncbi:MAG TPA: hypothetical protein VI072_28400 [Polyangiaceae bacterium]
MHGVELGLRLAVARLRTGRPLLGVLLSVVVVVAFAWAERRAGVTSAADRALSRVTFGAALPLVACFVFHVSCSARRLEQGLDVLGALGLNRRAAGLGVLGGSAVLCAALGAVLGSATVLVARSFGDPALPEDVLATTWIGALAGLAYAGWFALGSSFGQNGRARLWFLLADWLAGAAGTSVLPAPRVYVAGLIGATSAPDLPLMLCAGLLLVLTLACSLLALWRCAP